MDPNAIYFAPTAGQPWELYLPSDWTEALQVELRRAGARFYKARGYWTVPVGSVAAVNDLLLREGLRGTDEELTIDEVLSTMTPSELRYYPKSVRGRIEHLHQLPDDEYAELYRRAALRSRSELGPLLADVTLDQLRRLIRDTPELATLVKERNLTMGSSYADLEALVREYVQDAAHLQQLLEGSQIDRAPTDLEAKLALLTREELLRPAQQLTGESLTALRKATRAELTALIGQQYDQLAPETQNELVQLANAKEAARNAEEAAKQERREHREQLLREREQWRQREREQWRTEAYRNRFLYELLPELIGQPIPVRASRDFTYWANNQRYQAGELLTMGRVAKIDYQAIGRRDGTWRVRVNFEQPIPPAAYLTPVFSWVYEHNGVPDGPPLQYEGDTGIDLRPPLLNLQRRHLQAALQALSTFYLLIFSGTSAPDCEHRSATRSRRKIVSPG